LARTFHPVALRPPRLHEITDRVVSCLRLQMPSKTDNLLPERKISSTPGAATHSTPCGGPPCDATCGETTWIAVVAPIPSCIRPKRSHAPCVPSRRCVPLPANMRDFAELPGLDPALELPAGPGIVVFSHATHQRCFQGSRGGPAQPISRRHDRAPCHGPAAPASLGSPHLVLPSLACLCDDTVPPDARTCGQLGCRCKTSAGDSSSLLSRYGGRDLCRRGPSILVPGRWSLICPRPDWKHPDIPSC